MTFYNSHLNFQPFYNNRRKSIWTLLFRHESEWFPLLSYNYWLGFRESGHTKNLFTHVWKIKYPWIHMARAEKCFLSVFTYHCINIIKWILVPITLRISSFFMSILSVDQFYFNKFALFWVDECTQLSVFERQFMCKSNFLVFSQWNKSVVLHRTKTLSIYFCPTLKPAHTTR